MPPMKPFPLIGRSLAAALLAAGVVQARAQPQPAPPLPRELPAFGADPALPLPKITRHTLPNGLQVWVVPSQGLPRVDVVLAVRGAGSAADGPQQGGFTALLAGLLTEGTTQRDAQTLAQDIQALGGSLSATPSPDSITLGAQALPSKAGALMQLLAEVARLPAFDEAEVKLAKANAQQSLKASSATPGFRADGALGKAIYGGHPYGNTQPTEAAIEATTAAALRAAHAQRFRPDRALLVIAGRIHATQALAMADAAFASWQAQGAALPETPPAPRKAAPARVFLARPGSVQTTLRLGRPGIAAADADAVPLRVTSAVLGDGFSSRINLNLREEKGYTYGAAIGSRTSRAGGAISGGADVRNEVTGASLKEFEAEFARIGSQPVPRQELLETQRYLVGSYLVRQQSQEALAATLARNWVVGLPTSALGDYVQQVQRVTAVQVQGMAQKYYAPGSLSIVVVGDPAVAEQLKPHGDFQGLTK